MSKRKAETEYGYPTGKLLRVVRKPTGGGGYWYDYQYAETKKAITPHRGKGKAKQAKRQSKRGA